jgi:hypothetical protein
VTDPSSPISAARRPWLSIVLLVTALVLALIPLATLKSLGAPLWLAVTAAVLVFPVLPLAWHLLVERGTPSLAPSAPLVRLAVRAFVLAVLVLAVALASAGPRQLGRGLLALVGRKPKPVPAAPVFAPAAGGPRTHALEAFIPPDATLVVGMTGSKALEGLLAAHSPEARGRLTAFEKCQIPLDDASLLLAQHEPGTRLIVVRAPGITEVRNLYCLIGVFGTSHINLRLTSDHSPVRFELDGLTPQTLKFEAVDERTLVMAEGAWAGAARKPSDGGAGPLRAALERIDRGASLWAASVKGPEGASWDLALEARVEGVKLRLRASAIPPSGAGDQADLEVTVPSGFASALPGSSLEDAIHAITGSVGGALDRLAGKPAAGK